MGKKAKIEDSPAYQLISLVYRHQGHQQGRSRERWYHAMQAAARLAIRFGLRFDREDFVHLTSSERDTYRPRYCATERDYALACGCERGRGNKSAVLAFEHWRDRRPFMVTEDGSKTPTRIYVGRQFRWAGDWVTCTSFAEDNSYVVVCTYRTGEKYYPRKIERRIKLTREALRLGPIRN